MNYFNSTVIIGRVHSIESLDNAKGTYIKLEITNNSIVDGVEKIQTHAIHVFGKAAETVKKCIFGGELICVEGRLTKEVYEGISNSIVADRVVFLSSPKKKTETETVEQ